MPDHPAVEDFPCLDLATLQDAYRQGILTPKAVVETCFQRSEKETAKGVYIERVPLDRLRHRADEIEKMRAAGATLPLFGIPFSIKDNIDVAGLPTTAACPAFAYRPSQSAPVVARLEKAGAIVLGKTNLDQFATGLVGIRTPYSPPRNPFDPQYIPGGSSAGSAVSVALGLASFSLGTDTAGSGRIPAAFNNIVGLKPTRGSISAVGVVPACQSLDCVSIFARTCQDAWQIFEVARGFDPTDPYARPWTDLSSHHSTKGTRTFRFGFPAEKDQQFFGDTKAEAMFHRALDLLKRLGGEPVPVDLGPFLQAATLLYEGPWVAERLLATEGLLAANPAAIFPPVRTILQKAKQFDARSVFAAQAQLGQIRHRTQTAFLAMDILVTPTAPTHYTVDQVQADPLRLNTHLGYYTNFVNLLDLAAVAVPAGFRTDRLPFGITLLAPQGHDSLLIELGSRFHEAVQGTLEGSSIPEPIAIKAFSAPVESDSVPLAVVGAHLSGQPLNHQLIDRGASFVQTTHTASHYQLFALPNTTPPKPGLVRSDGPAGSIEVEIWRMSHPALGSFLAHIPAPLCIGRIELASGEWVLGFLCENHAVSHAKDITSFGGWRAYLRSL